jgi:hypothetical protein
MHELQKDEITMAGDRHMELQLIGEVEEWDLAVLLLYHGKIAQDKFKLHTGFAGLNMRQPVRAQPPLGGKRVTAVGGRACCVYG